MRRIFIVLAALLLVAVAASPAAACHDGRAFRAHVSGTDTVVFGQACAPAGDYHSEGEGNATHLGRITFTTDHCMGLDMATGTGMFWGGAIVLTSRHGSLILDHSGTFALTPWPDPTSGTIDLDWSVREGTGRYAGMTGSGTARGISDTVAGTVTVWFQGRLSR